MGPHIEAHLLVNSRAYVVKVDPQCGRYWAHLDFLRDVAVVLFLFGEKEELLPFSGGLLSVDLLVKGLFPPTHAMIVHFYRGQKIVPSCLGWS